MSFANGRMLWLLWITMPLLGWFLWWAWRRKQVLIAQFVQSRLLAHLTVGVSKRMQKARLALLWAAVGLLILTLARPQWGFVWEEAKQKGLDIVVAIDTSRSMLAEDVAPDRLTRAKLAALDLARLAKNDRFGLVAFAGTAFLQCPLTLDDEAFRQSVNALDVGIIPQGGSSLTEAIQTAAKAFKEEGDNHRILILLTDGEDHEAGATEAAELAGASRVRIFTVGVGTAAGELLPQIDEKGVSSYVKDSEGKVVKSRLNESLLSEIATKTQGFYLPLSGPTAMDVLFERGLAPLPRGEVSSKLVKRFKEQFQWLLGLAIALLVLEMFLPDRKRVAKTSSAADASINAGLRKAVTPVALAFLTLNAAASPGTALRRYEAGKYDEAQAEYQRLLERKPDDARLQYNAGAAAYQADKFDEAAKHFGASITSPDLDLQQRAYYNLGNSLYRIGDQQAELPKKMQSWEQSIKQFESSLKLNPQDADAKFNLDFVKKRIEELKQQQQQQQQKQNQNDKDKNNEEKNSDKNQDESKQDKNEESQPKPDESQPKPKPEQQDQQSQKQDQQQKEEKDLQNQHKPGEEKRPEKESKPQPKPSSQSGDKEDQESTPANDEVRPGQMTREQVKQLLEAQKNYEKAMIFAPKEKAEKSKNRVFKDW